MVSSAVTRVYGPFRDIQQAGVFLLALDLVVRPGQRVFVIVADVAVEFAVLLPGNLVAAARPQGTRLVDAFVGRRGLITPRLHGRLHLYRDGDVVGILAHDAAHAEIIGKFLRIGLQVQHHAGAAIGLLAGLHGEAVTGPVGIHHPDAQDFRSRCDAAVC